MRWLIVLLFCITAPTSEIQAGLLVGALVMGVFR